MISLARFEYRNPIQIYIYIHIRSVQVERVAMEIHSRHSSVLVAVGEFFQPPSDVCGRNGTSMPLSIKLSRSKS